MTPKQEIERQKILTGAYNDYQQSLSVHAFFKVHDTEKSEDLVQDTFLKTWKYLVKGGKIHLMRSFLYHILNDLVIDDYRKKKTTSLDTLLEKGFEPCDNPSVTICNALDGKAAVLLIEQLPQKYQKIMRMRYIQGLTITEVSLLTGQSKNTVAVQSCRGLEKLKFLYKPVGEKI